MLSKKKYNNTSISPGTAGKYVRRPSFTQSEDLPLATSSRQESSASPEAKKAPFDISQLPILNPGTLQQQYAFRRNGRDRHPVKRANLNPPTPKSIPNSNQLQSSLNSTPTVCQQSTDPFLKVSHYSAPVAMMSTQMPSHITVGVAQPVQLVHSGQKGQLRGMNKVPTSLHSSAEVVGGHEFSGYPMSFSATNLSIEGAIDPIVPPNPMVHAEVDDWIKVYVQAHPRHDDKLEWSMFSLPQLTNYDQMVRWQMKREIEEIVLAYERYRVALIQEKERRKIDANRYIMPS